MLTFLSLFFYQVKFIDYGNVDETMPVKLLCDFAPHMQDLKLMHLVPPLALECTLTGIAPASLRNENDIWSQASIERFKKMIDCDELIGEVCIPFFLASIKLSFGFWHNFC